MDDAPPIFIMSSERSGTNLLQTLLSNHSRIAGPRAPQLLQLFHRIVPFYGDLGAPDAARRLFDDMLSIANHEYFDWGLDVSFEDACGDAPPTTFLDVFDAVYRADTRRRAKARYVVKENNVFDHAPFLHAKWPEASFVYLHRDPRDCAASWMKVFLGPKTPLEAAERWAEENTHCLALIHSYGFPALRLSYEDLVADTEASMRAVLEHVGETAETACFQTDGAKNEQVGWNTAWKNLSKPVMRSNTGKYRSVFDEETIKLIETTCRNPMTRLGYGFDTTADWTSSRAFRKAEKARAKAQRRARRDSTDRQVELFADRNVLYRRIVATRRQEWLDRD